MYAYNIVTKELKLPIPKRIVWTDCECVLHCVISIKPLPLFVKNQIIEIQKEKDITFCYIPSKQNPADYTTRGFTVPEIVAINLWRYGLGWLTSDEYGWHTWNLPDVTPEILE